MSHRGTQRLLCIYPCRVEPRPELNRLYYGDNLDILREHIADRSVDLVYLDPPFNSNRAYNVIFGTTGRQTGDGENLAQVESTGVV